MRNKNEPLYAILFRDTMIAYIISTYKNKSTISLDFLFCFGPLEPRLDSGLEIVWKKYQVFSPAAELFLKRLEETFLPVLV